MAVTDSYERMFINIPEDAKILVGDEVFENARDLHAALIKYGHVKNVDFDAPCTLRAPVDVKGLDTYVTEILDTEHNIEGFDGEVVFVWGFEDDQIEGLEDSGDWPWNDAHLEIVPCEGLSVAWTVFDSTVDGQPLEGSYRTAEEAVEYAEWRWANVLSEEDRRSCIRSRTHEFYVLDPQGYAVRDFGEELDRQIERQSFAEDTEEHLGNVIASLSNRRGHEWVDSAYALADAWDGDEGVGELMHEYDMDADEAMDMLDALTAIHVIAAREAGE